MSTDRWVTLTLVVASAVLMALNEATPLIFVFGWIGKDFWDRNEDWIGLSTKGEPK